MITPSPLSPAPPVGLTPDQRVQTLSCVKFALAHDWLQGTRGGEWVLSALLPALPPCPIHTLFYYPPGIEPLINRQAIHPSPLNRLPGVRRYYRWTLPVMPAVIERTKIAPDVQAVLALSHCVACGVRVPRGAMHINYYFSPMRYLYDQNDAYGRGGGGLAHRMLELIAPRLRAWDRAAAQRADAIWTLSNFVAGRIERAFGRKARVIYPPVRADYFTPPPPGDERVDEALMVSAMVPYKRVDLALEAAKKTGLPLRIAGDGPLLDEMRRRAPDNVFFEGRVGDERLRELYRTRRMLLFPGEEDFGIVPLEALACAMPVLALGAGGALETLTEGETGAFFDRPGADCLAEAWRAFDPDRYDVQSLRARAERFDENTFRLAITDALIETLNLE